MTDDKLNLLNQLMDSLTQAVHRKENRIGTFDEIYEVIDQLNYELEEEHETNL